MADERYRRADPHGVIALFAGTAPVARSPEGAYVAWRFSLQGGLDPAVAAAVVLDAGACRRRRPEIEHLRQLLERTRGLARVPANDNPDPAET